MGDGALVLRLPRPLYPETAERAATHGPDVVAVKRATARAFPSIYPWADFDQVYNARIERAWKSIQASCGIAPARGNYGAQSHKLLEGLHSVGHPTQWAFDQTAINLLAGEWKVIHPPPDPLAVAHAAMADFFNRSIAVASSWHYRMFRPMQYLGVPPERVHYNDCSEGATEAFFWVRAVTGILVPDPNGRSYDGLGNTETLWGTNVSRLLPHDALFEVGDLALFTAHGGHVIACMEGGTWDTAVWWSNGSEAGPYPVKVYYRSDLRGIVRPIIVP